MKWRVCVLVVALCALPGPAPASHAGLVKKWARNLGDELWKLSEALTNSDHIRIKYKQMNASVKKKDGKQILDSALRSVSTMLTRKINAVKCIHATAEHLAREFNYTKLHENDTFEYCSAKYSTFIGEDGEVPKNLLEKRNVPSFAVDNEHYKKISLEQDSHFYDINVNTNISCVHVPTNIFYMENNVLQAIMWSKGLNDIFVKNYQSDPSLSWQYFGSSHGILRFYPGMPWNTEKVDIYDCRVKSWYIEAATCSKDVVILFDVSGSMTGFKNYVARQTLTALLATLSNNDFVNVYAFNKNTSKVVECFNGLVQATPENLKTFTVKLEPTEDGKKHKFPLEGYANLTTAYIAAFKTLKARRKWQDCNVSSTQGCNQLVMLITDYVPGNLTEVFEEYNREEVNNKTFIPVRVFTYLIGKEVTNVAEIQWMACFNRGYFVHIHSVEEVQQQVLKYINVIARPMILTENVVPPPTWTHANIDSTRTKEWMVSGDVEKPDEDKLVTSVAIPAFDYRHNEENNDAILLGVAGTDVPIDSIAKLAQPNQLGVNGYSFIVSNNGYLLLHPLLIATINDNLQPNYNSVDFVEVEQVDDNKSSRELGDEIKQLRESLVKGVDGHMMNVKVLYHYDNMRRIARVKHNYFYNQLNQTPFSMGISLPDKYGDTELLLKDNPLEAKEPVSVTGINVTQYFNISFRVHPDWVYCKYHYLEGHESENAEQEVWKFLSELSWSKIDITKSQYPEEAEINTSSKSKEFDYDYHCGNGTKRLGKDDYYCNEDLVKQLVFDAKLTHEYFQKWEATAEEQNLANKYNVSVRFVATSSGLTRWHYIKEKDKHLNEKFYEHGNRSYHSEKVFGDIYHNAIEETWYKAAVLQNINNKESIVIATPLPVLDDTINDRPPVLNENDDIVMTSSYAIFYKDGDSETPASVVGFQFMYSSFYEAFIDIASDSKDLSCEDDDYACYIIDSSGYIVLSENKTDVGEFFGVKQPYVLQNLMDKKIFEHVEVFNYQALCDPGKYRHETGCAWRFSTPLSLTMNFFHWLLTEVILLWSNMFNSNGYVSAGKTDTFDDYTDYLQPDNSAPTTVKPDIANETAAPKANEKVDFFSCDHQISLFILNQTFFIDNVNPVISEDKDTDCSPEYYGAYVTKTNLLLIVVHLNTGVRADCIKPPDTKPIPTESSTRDPDPCHKLDLGNLPRRRLEGCYTYHDKEKNITACGLGSTIRANAPIFGITSILVFIISRIH